MCAALPCFCPCRAPLCHARILSRMPTLVVGRAKLLNNVQAAFTGLMGQCKALEERAAQVMRNREQYKKAAQQTISDLEQGKRQCAFGARPPTCCQPLASVKHRLRSLLVFPADILFLEVSSVVGRCVASLGEELRALCAQFEDELRSIEKSTLRNKRKRDKEKSGGMQEKVKLFLQHLASGRDDD